MIGWAPTPMSDLTSQGRVRCRGAKYAGTQQDQPSTDQPETGGTALDALTPDEQHELLDKTRYIYDQLGPVSTRGASTGI
ncbi:hypothetical protein I552_10258 [Mycobacterium xenopi 3993]|nr:hypothetical protein I552_10258 [Mycobacterium xenopi 3993]